MNRLNYLKDNFIKNRILVENFTFLSALHVTNLLLFIITIPYLFRVLGSHLYGLIIFAQTIAFYFSIFVNFGFNLTATRDISIERDNKNNVSEIVSSVLLLKSLFFLISFLVMLFFTSIINSLHEYRLLFLLSMITCLSEALFPVFYFQGIEKMKYITFINVTTRVLATATLFLFIRNSGDYLYYPLIMGAGTVTGSIIALVIVFRKHRLRFVFQRIEKLKAVFQENLLYFFSNVSTQIYANANKVVIGSLMGMVEVAYYDVAEKVINIVKVPFSLMGQTLFPHVAKERANLRLKRFIYLSLLAATTLVLFIIGFSGDLVRLLSGNSQTAAATVLSILALSLLPISVGIFFGDLLLINYELGKEYINVRVSGLIIYFIGLLILIAAGWLTLVSISVLLVLVELFISGYSYLICRKAGIRYS